MTLLQLTLNDNLYSKDPQSSLLGKKIVRNSIEMIDLLGFEAFTFKKLSKNIDSTEASVYRYFENKHRLLMYLITWYWAWLEYQIDFETHNLTNPKDQLDRALRIITEKKEQDHNFPEINESALQRIVIAESDKTYLTKNVDTDNRSGLFKGYKSLCIRISKIVKALNADFPYPHALISTVLEAAHQQIFFATHLPTLSELSKKKDLFQANYEFLKTMVFKTITHPNP